ncbi:MAG: hypothetical protein CM1200mP10_29540 [Candidatus Neomarinimicrobiota bacterium]|nr:MAG: hypothetical protein CM1200mP10_29540 [Candidatus Neomarinimicrobiota bacterium]
MHFATEKLETHVRLETGGIKISTDLNGNQTADIPIRITGFKYSIINRMMVDIGMGSN